MCLQDWANLTSIAIPVVLLLGAFLALKTLRLDRFRSGSDLIGHKSHVSRYAGVCVLIDLYNQWPHTHRANVEKAFFAFLKHPPHFTDNQKKDTDYESIDTVAVVNFLNSRRRSQRALFPRLPPERPFKLDDDHCVIPNAGHRSYTAWLDRMGRAPDYDVPRD